MHLVTCAKRDGIVKIADGILHGRFVLVPKEGFAIGFASGAKVNNVVLQSEKVVILVRIFLDSAIDSIIIRACVGSLRGHALLGGNSLPIGELIVRQLDSRNNRHGFASVWLVVFEYGGG
jgi:hypothetical protein